MKTKIYLYHSYIEFIKQYKINILTDSILHYFKWRKSFKTNEKLDDFIPWMNFNIISWLERFLTKEMVVFEYGSGNSSFFYSRKVKKLVSLEHDADWFEQQRMKIESYNISNVDYQLILPEKNEDNIINRSTDISDPTLYISDDENYLKMNFINYVSYIDKFPNEFFDLIVIDGRARPSCLMHSLKKVKPNGFILIDNTERDYYLNHFKKSGEINHWKIKEYIGHVPGLYHYCKSTLLSRSS